MEFPKLGPGSLKFGETASVEEFALACSSVTLAPDMKDEDAVPLLDGGDYTPEGTISGDISGTLYQDFDEGGLVAWTYKNAGKVLPFTFTPVSGTGFMATGRCKIKPVKIGGDVKKANTTDFSFPIIGDLPALTAQTGGTGE